MSALRRRYGHADAGALADRLLAVGARTHAMFPEAVAKVHGFNPAQAIFFAMTSRRDDARVFDASIGKSEMDHAARQAGGIVKIGFVVDGVAYVMPRKS